MTTKHISLNSPHSYDSNDGIYMQIRALYEEIRKLPDLCLPVLENTWISCFTSYYISLKRYSQRESSAVGIVGNGSVVAEKRWN